MHLLFWVVVIIGLLALGIVLKRTWLDAPAGQEEAAPDAAAAATEQQSGFAAQQMHALQTRVQELRAAFGRQDPAGEVGQFREWAAVAYADDVTIQPWLNSLTDAQIAALADHLTVFCRDMGFELSWLTRQETRLDAVLADELAGIVLLYLRSARQAVDLQPNVEILRIYRDLLQNPDRRANRALGEHLFGKLVEAGMTDVTLAELMAASEGQRQERILATIQQTATDEPHILMSSLRSVLMERTSANGTASANGAGKRTSAAKA